MLSGAQDGTGVITLPTGIHGSHSTGITTTDTTITGTTIITGITVVGITTVLITGTITIIVPAGHILLQLA
jgi:hypothetical protein